MRGQRTVIEHSEYSLTVLSTGSVRDRTIINEFLWLELEDMNVDDVYSNKTALRTTQVVKPSVFCLESYQAE